MRKIYLIIVLSIFSFAIANPVLGQPGDPGGGGNPGEVPISGIEILLAVGALFGIRSIAKKKG